MQMLKTKIFYLILSVMSALVTNVFSQNDSTYFKSPKKDSEKSKKEFHWPEKIRVGGNFAFFSSTNATFIDISPLVGYSVSDYLFLGAGPVYNYYRINYGYRYSFDVYGFRTLARVYFLQSLFFQTGWDILNRSIYTIANNQLQKDRMWIQNFWLGGGVRYMIGANAYMFTSILYNLNYNSNYSLYPNPYIQIGIITGF